MDNLLNLLELYIKKHPERCYFDPGVSLKEIQIVEIRNKINLPHSYKKFLQKYNGGFIAFRSGMKLPHLNWEANYIFSLNELESRFQEKRDISWKIDSDFKGPYPFIPICGLPNNELLVTVNREEEESPIFDAWHEAFSSEWGLLYSTFTDFLREYLKNNGLVDSIGGDESKNAKSFIPAYELTRFYKAEQRFNSGLDLLCELKYAAAAVEISQALQIDPTEAQYYFFLCRSYAGSKDFSSALFAIEQALKLEPDDRSYLFQQADVLAKLQQLGKMEIVLNKIKILFFKDVGFYLDMGRVMISAKNDEKALQYFEDGLKSDASNIDLLNEIAYLYCRMKKYTIAEEYVNKILDLEDENALAYHTLIEIYLNTNNEKGMERISTMIEKLLYN